MLSLRGVVLCAIVVAQGAAAQKVYWVEFGGNQVRRSNRDGTMVENLVGGLNGPSGIALDLGAGKMYWTDFLSERIMRANLDGTIVETRLTRPPGSNPVDIALDAARGKMYWVEQGSGMVLRANLDGSMVETLVTGGINITGMTLDLTSDKIYWTDQTASTIQRANLDGTMVELLVGVGSVSGPLGIAVDHAGGKMYFCDHGLQRVMRANLSGAMIEDLVTVGQDTPAGIDLDLPAGKMYWVDEFTDSLQRANLDGTMVEIIHAGLPFPFDLALDTAAGTCSINSPAMGAALMGLITVDYDVDHTMMLTLDVTFEYSTDLGVTWSPATAAGASVNPRLGVPTPSAGLAFEWDSAADGIGTMAPQATDLRIQVHDGVASGGCRVTGLLIDNTIPPPTCTLAQSVPGTAGNVEPFDLVPDSTTAAAVDATFEYSLDMGATWIAATPGGASTNPMLGLPILTLAVFEWDSRADGVALAALVPGVLLRATATDGSPSPGICVTAPFDVDNTALCQARCGDCDRNSQGPDVIDALTAAQIAVLLVVPTFEQTACCDVNSSMSVDVVDALIIAQDAAGLFVSLVCP